MKRFAVALLAFAASGATAALAADMTAPVYKTSPAPNWTGFYLGINAGGGIAIGEFLDSDVTAADLKINDPSATVGGQFGYNWQWRAMVLGLEGDFNWNSANKTLPYGENDAGCNTDQCPATFKMDAYASIRGRMGLAYDNGLVYVTAGPVFGHFNSSVNLAAGTTSCGFPCFATDQGWHTGIAAGTGLEFMLTNNLTLRGEALYLLFQDVNGPYLLAGGGGSPCGSSNSCGINFTYSALINRLGLNWKFDN